MYRITHSLKNLIRHEKRYLMTGAGVVFFMTFFFYAAFYQVQMRAYNEYWENECLSRVEMRFRDDLQYRGDRGCYDNGLDYIIPEENFNYDGSMDAYDFDLTADRAFFEKFAEIDCVEEAELVCGAKTYAEMLTWNGNERRLQLLLYGGSMDVITLYSDEIRQTSLHLRIEEGREALPGQNECVLYRDFARMNDISVGDTVTLHDESGNALITLIVAGLAAAYIDDGNAGKVRAVEDSELNKLNYLLGSMPYRRTETSIYYTVFTDFDTAYTVYGDEADPRFAENHTFNNYIPFFRLTSPEDYSAFAKAAAEMGHDYFLAFYPLSNALKSHDEYFEEELAWKVMLITGGLGFLVILVSCVILFRERGQENEIYHALGISNRTILAGSMTETAVFLLILAACSLIFSSLLDGFWKLIDIGFFIEKFRFALSAEGFALVGVFLMGLWLTSGVICGANLWMKIGKRGRL